MVAPISENSGKLLSDGTVMLPGGVKVLPDNTVVLNSQVTIRTNGVVTLPTSLQDSVVQNIPSPFLSTQLEDIDLFELLLVLFYTDISLRQDKQLLEQALEKFLGQVDDPAQKAAIEDAENRFFDLLADRDSELVNFPSDR